MTYRSFASMYLWTFQYPCHRRHQRWVVENYEQLRWSRVKCEEIEVFRFLIQIQPISLHQPSSNFFVSNCASLLRPNQPSSTVLSSKVSCKNIVIECQSTWTRERSLCASLVHWTFTFAWMMLRCDCEMKEKLRVVRMLFSLLPWVERIAERN